MREQKLEDKINIQKSVIFLLINNRQPQNDSISRILLIIASKRIKYLVINLTKELKDLNTQNYKTLSKEI